MKFKLSSTWQHAEEIYKDNGSFTIIIGEYENKRTLGVHWRYDFPKSHNRETDTYKLAPCVIPKQVANGMLSGLISEAINMGDNESLEKLQKVYRYINE